MYRRTAFAVGRAEKIKQPDIAMLAVEEEMRKHWYAFAITLLTDNTPDKAMLYMGIAPVISSAHKSRVPKRASLYAEASQKLYILTKICGMKAAEVGRLVNLEDWAVRYAVQVFRETGGMKNEKHVSRKN